MLALIMNFILSKISQYNNFSHLFNIKKLTKFYIECAFYTYSSISTWYRILSGSIWYVFRLHNIVFEKVNSWSCFTGVF